MQLNDILEEHSLKQISKRTKISEENIEKILEKKFDKIDRVKAIGFISIIEREFDVKLDALKQEANNYYTEHVVHAESITVGLPITSSKRGKSKWFLTVVFALLAYASWYFVTQFDKSHLNTLFTTTEDMTKMVQSAIGEDAIPAKELVIGNTLQEETQSSTAEQTQSSDASTQVAQSEALVEEVETNASVSELMVTQADVNISEENTTEENRTEEPTVAPVALTTVSIVPVGKLWFGQTQRESKSKKQQVIASKQEFDTNGKSYLLATSTAPFTVVYGEMKKEFKDAKIHYLLLDVEGVRDLSKQEYTQLGGWGW